MRLPSSVQRLFWSDDAGRLDTEKHKSYIIHHVLLYGSFADIRWLFSVYTKEEIIHSFITRPSKIYPKEVFFFIKNYVLGLPKTQVDEQDYITSISGPIRQRTAGNVSPA